MAKRRSNGEGACFKLANGTWRGYVTQNGKRKYFSGATDREVKAKVRRAIRDQEAGVDLGADKITVKTFLDNWLAAGVKPNHSPVTYSTYESQVRVHIIPAFEKVTLQGLTAQQIQLWVNKRTEGGTPPRTVRYAFVVLKTALRQAVRWNMIARSPADNITLPKAGYPNVVYWTPEQSRLLLRQVEGDRYEALYALALSLGLRSGELLGLAWAAVDLDHGLLTVRTNLQRVRGAYIMLGPKTKAGLRTVRLPQFVLRLLEARRSTYHEERKAAGEGWRGDKWDIVFGSYAGAPITSHYLSALLTKHSVAAGLPRITVHGMRHTAATGMIAAGINIKVISTILGHSNVSITLNIYGHVLDSQIDGAADTIDALLVAPNTTFSPVLTP